MHLVLRKFHTMLESLRSCNLPDSAEETSEEISFMPCTLAAPTDSSKHLPPASLKRIPISALFIFSALGNDCDCTNLLLGPLQKPLSERFVVPGIGRYMNHRKKELVCFEMLVVLFCFGGFWHEKIYHVPA